MQRHPWKIYKLQNRIRVALYPTPYFHHIGIGAYVIFGSHDETKETREIAHLIEHCVFDGTKKFPTQEDIESYCDKIAGDFTGAVGKEITQYSGIFPDSELNGGMDLLDQLLFNPLFKEKNIECEKTVVVQELLLRWDNIPAKIALRALWNRLKNEKHPYLFTLKELLQKVKSTTKEDITHNYRKYYQPKNIIIGIYGHFSIQEAEKAIKSLESYKNIGGKIERIDFNPKEYSNQVIDITKENCNKIYLLLTFPGFKRPKNPRKRLISNLLLTLLINKRDSQIYSTLREKLGAVYEIGGDFSSGRNIGIFEIGTSCTPENYKIVLETTVKEIEKMKNGYINLEVLKRVVEGYKKSVKMTFDYPGKALEWILTDLYEYGRVFSPETCVEIEESIKKEEITKLANKIFNWKKVNITVFTPQKPEDLKATTEKIFVKYNLSS